MPFMTCGLFVGWSEVVSYTWEYVWDVRSMYACISSLASE
jgi:hypothetical protein